jgi:hypothetical protein
MPEKLNSPSHADHAILLVTIMVVARITYLELLEPGHNLVFAVNAVMVLAVFMQMIQRESGCK